MSLIWAAFFQLLHLGRGDCWNDIPRTFAAPGKEAHDVWLSKLVEWRDHHLKYHGCYLKWKKSHFCYFFGSLWCLKTRNHRFHPYLWHLVAADFEKSQDLHRRGVWGSVSQLDAHFICPTTSSPLWQAWRNLSLTCGAKPMFTLICLKWSLISCTVILKVMFEALKRVHGRFLWWSDMSAPEGLTSGFQGLVLVSYSQNSSITWCTVLNASSVKLVLQVSLWWGVDGGSLPGWSHTTLWRYWLSTDLAHLHQHWYWWEEPCMGEGWSMPVQGRLHLGSGPSSAGISSTTFVPCRVDWLDLPTSLSNFTREVSEFCGVSCPAGRVVWLLRQAHFLIFFEMTKKPNKYSKLLWVWMFCHPFIQCPWIFSCHAT